MKRRHLIVWAAASAWAGRAASASAPLRIAAAWQRNGAHQAGVLRRDGDRFVIEQAFDLPSRPHALRVDDAGRVIVVARRPGDWLMRWTPGTTAPTWHWIEPDRSFNGHLLPSVDGQRLFTTETDLATGASLLGVRDAASFEKLAEWPTGGTDAHDLIYDGGAHLIVANGGVTTQQETGRLKLKLDTMDSSIVRLDAATGEPKGQWRLTDRRLSLRHLAWGRRDASGARRLGVALQAEHADATQRAAAPVLALFDGNALQTCEMPFALAGYGGDIVAHSEGFTVSCPRADAIATWHADGRWNANRTQPQACALLASDAFTPEQVWSGGANAVAWRHTGAEVLTLPNDPAIHLENHWALLPHQQITDTKGTS